ncbi:MULTISPECIES: hypothetical protein [Colwellia]|uniref:Uncharacterized protein n=1 Tax=Colwellia marinimaniae TaxID=1513592 RepID=A0ABQ0MX59_9GAMM|nr:MULTISPECIES: hypothetical protein [Colwellia]GAW96957.1 hypothetical protein MTCD1_02580 [Colwellia marinimaniae]
MYNLFYVESPLQMLSAISAVKKFNQHKAILIVNLSNDVDRKKNDTQLLALIGSEWDKVIIKKSPKGRLSALIDLLRYVIPFIALYRNKINQYFIGEYRSIDMVMLNIFISPKETILLDDGSFTITAQHYYITNNITPYGNSIKHRLLEPLIKNLKVPNLYSFFNLELLKGQVNYFVLPVKKIININKGSVYFFGSKLSESKNVLLNDELDVLSQVLKLYEGYQVYYIPHRDENISKLNVIEKLGYCIKCLGIPAEVYFEETDIMPEIIISYYSTVLYTCYLRFKNVEIRTVNIESIILPEKSAINAKEIYGYYKGLGIKDIIIQSSRIEQL